MRRSDIYDRTITSECCKRGSRKRATWFAYLGKLDSLGHYDFALYQISKGEDATIQTKWNGLSMPGIIAVSMQKLSSSNEFFAYVLSMCKEGHYEGPITLIPSNEVIDFRWMGTGASA